jgi:glycosyltransferase involved in cell wall biosynthesis
VRVHFVGNGANNHYVLAKAMRRHGIDARLFYDQSAPTTDLPEMDDPEILRERPDWLRPYPRQFRLWQQRDRVAPDLLREIGNCDILHAHSVELIWAARTGKPFVFHPYGGDFSAWTSFNRDSMIRWRPWPPLPILPHFTLPPKMRWAMRRASAIALGWHNNMWRRGYQVLHALGLEDRVVRIHLGYDVEKFVPCAPGKRDAILAGLLPGRTVERPLIFHPSRQKFRDPGSMRGYKANDRLYTALARRARDGAKFTLVLVDRGGLDEPEAKRMLRELGISDRAIWVDMIPRHRLVEWYQAADITVESFYTGAIGGVPLESMACGTPVLMHLQTEPSPEDQGIFYDPRELYPSLPPIIEARTEDEIYRALRDSLASPARLAEIGMAGRNWVVANSSADAVARKFEAVYEAVLTDARQAGAAHGGARMREIGGTT